ncbi:hypothetical protein [Aquimarina sp. AU474]|uniref:hypothetical protein n=1 Tax=Aquimarina sp. AU474 TaxID=2108529 RepID=UPI00135A4A6E|nr:hypothetical protein [Aquimarina sp. AU474]
MKKQILKNDNISATINLNINFLPFKASYGINYTDSNSTLTIEYKGLFKPYYKFVHDNNLYEIYPHRGTKTSIFKNNKQIAFYEHTFLNRFNKSLIKINCDSDINIDILFTLISVIDFDFDEDSQTVTIDFGNIFQARKFDENWSPT